MASGKNYRLGVGIMLLNDINQLFVGQRLDSSSEAWQMPQGGIDPEEPPIEAAYRELQEETGISSHHVTLLKVSSQWVSYDLPPDLRGKLWGGQYVGQKQKWFAFRFLGKDQNIHLTTATPEFRSWRWVEHDEIMSLIVPFKKTIYEEILAEFSDLFAPSYKHDKSKAL